MKIPMMISLCETAAANIINYYKNLCIYTRSIRVSAGIDTYIFLMKK